MSDTHSLQRHIKFPIPHGDIFIHAGDFTKCGLASEVAEFNEWLGRLPHAYKIVIAGNHELSFDPHFSGANGMLDVNKISTLGLKREKMVQAVQDVDAKNYLTNCIYLEDTGTQIWGIKIYGTPWQPEFCKWAFNLPRGRPCLDKWRLIPTDTDVLVTHTPPVGHGDYCCSGVRAGCVDLLKEVQSRIRPRYHVFGHVHEGYGITSDGEVIYVNASTCNINYRPQNLPVIFDYPLPNGVLKW